MGIDSISGPKGPTGPKGPSAKQLNAPEAAHTTATTTSSQVVQSLATQVRQGTLSYDDALKRFAADVVSRRYPGMTGELRERAIREVGKTLAQDPAFVGRFSRLLAQIP